MTSERNAPRLRWNEELQSAPREALLTEAEAARMLGLATPTLRRWRWAGRGPRFAKIGAAVRYDPAELRDYIESCTRASTSDTGSST